MKPIDVKRERLITALRRKTGLWGAAPEFVLSATEGTYLRALVELSLALQDCVREARNAIVEVMERLGRAILRMTGR